jgi:phosphatidylethanolamine N-methyltransferase
MDRVLGETLDQVEDFLDSTRPKLAAGINTIVKDTKDLFQKYPARINITRVESEVIGFNPKDYKLEIEGSPASALAETERSSDKEALQARVPPKRTNEYKTLMFEYGAPITVKWTAPTNHGTKDWVGLYMITDNASRKVTKISSSGRWVATNRGAFDAQTSEVGLIATDRPTTQPALVTGTMLFFGDKLWWTQGAFEFRYHHNSSHNVMAISLPFEVRIPRSGDDDLQSLSLTFNSFSNSNSNSDELIRRSIESTLLPIVQNCFDQDPEIAPHSPGEGFGARVERDGKFARRVVYAIQMMFGIEFAPEVVKADGNIRNLAWRIWEAKKVLVSPVSVYLSIHLAFWAVGLR